MRIVSKSYPELPELIPVTDSCWTAHAPTMKAAFLKRNVGQGGDCIIQHFRFIFA
jgi:hypothetical protein